MCNLFDVPATTQDPSVAMIFPVPTIKLAAFSNIVPRIGCGEDESWREIRVHLNWFCGVFSEGIFLVVQTGLQKCGQLSHALFMS